MECNRKASNEDNVQNPSKKVEPHLVRIMPRHIGDCVNNTEIGESSPIAMLPVMQYAREMLDSTVATTTSASEPGQTTGSGAMLLLMNMSTIVDTLRNLTIRAAQQPFRSNHMEDFQRLRFLYSSASEMNSSLLRAINRVRVSEPISSIGDMDIDELTSVLSTEFMVHWLNRRTTGTSDSHRKITTPHLGPHYFERDESVPKSDYVGMNLSFAQWQTNIWPHIATTITEAAASLPNADNAREEQNNNAAPGGNQESID